MITQGEKKLFLIDSYALIYRAYFAFIKNPRMSSKGLDTSAIYGFLNTLTELIREEKPTHIAAVFDLKGPTKRHDLYTEYKANRDAMPEGISLAIPYIKELLDALKIQKISLPGYEADDLIGTLGKKAEEEGFSTYMITPDKDFAQLVTEKTFIYKPGKRSDGPIIMGKNEVCEKYGLKDINQFIDFLAMMGDSSDNIPGITGVGPKTAQNLIQEYGSMEEVYNNVDQIKGKLKEKLIESRDNAFLSKKLVRIITDAPINVSISELLRKSPNLNLLESLCEELEFKNILPRIKKALDLDDQVLEGPVHYPKESQLDLFNQEILEEKKQVLYKSNTWITTPSEIESLQKKILKHNKLAIELLFELGNKESLKFILIALENKAVFTIQLNNENKEIANLLLINIFNNQNILKVGFDVKKIIKTIYNLQCIPQSKNLFDIMLAGYLLNSDASNSIDRLSMQFIPNLLFDSPNDINPNLHEKQYINALCNHLIIYLNLELILAQKLKEDKLNQLFWDVEMKLVLVLAEMELVGFSVDQKILKSYSSQLKESSSQLQAQIFDISNKEFNISSPKQLGDVLFEDLKIDQNAKKTKTGQFSTSEPVLQKLKNKHPIINLILEYRSVEKLLSTYVHALPSLINLQTQKIHSSFHQAVTATGRLSSREPNLQNIPIRTKKGKEIRKAFVPSKHNILISADYSQIELRLIAELSQEPTMINSFSLDEDIHRITASKIFKVPLSAVTPEMRSNAKTVNFGIIYGVSAFGLSQQTNLTRKESASIIESYFQEYSKLKDYMSKNIAFARDYGYVQTILGRRRYLNDINSRNALLRSHAERNAVNAPIQGSAADIIKLAMIKINEELIKRKLNSKLILQVHDELIFDVVRSEKLIVKELIKENMETAYQTSVPLKVEIGEGENWLIAH